MDHPHYSRQEMMVVAASRELLGRETVFVGIGVPNAAVNLARRTHAPDLTLIYESGAIGSRPAGLPLSIGDPMLVRDSAAIVPMFEVFSFYLQRGFVDVGFLGGAQTDRFGNINSTVIGEYARPKVRLPGSGGACEIALLSKRVLIILKHDRRSLVERVDFITSPGHGPGIERPPGRLGPQIVLTDLGILRWDSGAGEMTLTSMHPGVTLEQVRAATGWNLRVAVELTVTPAPAESELAVLRGELGFR